MNEQTTEITIPLWEYVALVRTSERVETLFRMINRAEFVTLADVKSILDIVESEGENGLL